MVGARSGDLDGRRLTHAGDRDGGQAETGERVARRPQSIGFDYRILVRDGDQIVRSERRCVIVIVHEWPHRDNLEIGG